MHPTENCCLITGASSGLGMEFARQLAPRSSTLILVARRMDRLEALRCELLRPGLTIHCRQVDLANSRDLDGFLAWLSATKAPLSFLVNNAGLGDDGDFERSEWERVNQMLEVNIRALTRLTLAALPVLRKQPSAAILNVSSIAGFLPVPKTAVYAASKAYVSSLSEALRCELRGTGVRVTAVCPGPVATEFKEVASRRNEKTKSLNPPPFFKTPAQKVVRDALAAVDGDRARVVPGWYISAVLSFAATMPMPFLRWALTRRAKD
ncbi:MAG: SDR family NAD(P)-dependent oxidoreductase [Chthoniobacteraceae bacterium]